jgi:hypothetical protein
MKIIPKKENQNVGFFYTVTDEQIAEHQKKSVEEIINWVERTAEFIYNTQTSEERERMQKAIFFLNGNV